MNPCERGTRVRHPAVLGEPIVDPTGWSNRDFVARDRYLYVLSSDEIDEIMAAADQFEQTGIELKDLNKDKFVITKFEKTLLGVIHDEVLNGRGFIFLRGLPVEDRSVLQHASVQWGLASYLGSMLPQNKQGNLLEHVKNAGGDIDSPIGRGYNSANTLGFHSDDSDAFSLMCLYVRKSGGEHRIVSSVTVYNAMLDRFPSFTKELEFLFYRSRRGEIPHGKVPFIRQPVFSVTDGFFCARGASSTLNRAQELPGVPKLTRSQQDAISSSQALCSELSLIVNWQPGDVSFVLNHVALHARTAYQDWPEPDKKRHVLCSWINLEKKRPIHDTIAQDMSGIKLPEGTNPNTPLDMTQVVQLISRSSAIARL